MASASGRDVYAAVKKRLNPWLVAFPSHRSAARSSIAGQNALEIRCERLKIRTWLRLTEPRSDNGNSLWHHRLISCMPPR